ncbi:MAG: ABC transporter ATP-binding protein [Alphaproteobacteria bacterium]|nr:ABC transporter ATP-binding protein [Alphaproteobacteria bacterium]
MTALIRLRQISKAYQVGGRPLPVLQELDLDIHEGELVSIMGSSGSGKSTLLNILGVLDRYDSGSYHLGDTLIRDLSEREAARIRSRDIGFVFQSFNLLPTKTAAENVALPLYYQQISRRQRMERALEMLGRMGLADWAEHLPTQLSGGQKQRVAIARALVSQPKVILADEPTGALDTTTSYTIMDLLEEVHAEGITIIVVTHENDIAARTKRIIRLRDGQIVDDAQ